MFRKLAVFVAVSTAAALAGVPAAQSSAEARTLYGTVGPGFKITLKTSSGARVRSLRAGRYVIVVRDKSAEHNFRLSGPGVSRSTAVASTGVKRWRLKLSAGAYTYLCDPHSGHMRGTFRVR